MIVQIFDKFISFSESLKEVIFCKISSWLGDAGFFVYLTPTQIHKWMTQNFLKSDFTV